MERIEVSREEQAVEQALRAILSRGGFGAAAAAGENLNLSHTGRRPRVFSRTDIIRMGYRLAAGGQAQAFDLSLTDVHVDALLTNISIGYRNTDYIAPLVFPRVPVTKESGKYFTFDRADLLRSEAGIRGVGARFQRTGWDMSTGSYSADEFGLETPVDDRVRANADGLALDTAATEFVSDQVDLKLEKDVASVVFGSGWTGAATLSGTDQWSDVGSNPMGNMSTARLSVLSNTGKKPNTVIMGVQVLESLMEHPDLIDRIKYTGTSDRPSMVTPAMLAALFQVEQVLIGTALENTAVEGATAVYAYIWGKKVWVGYVSPTPALNTPSAGYVFSTGRIADRYREPQTRSDIIRASEAFDTKLTAAGGGYLYSAAVA